jgi:trehalose/maltose hydrolase-like predicted phosphorylase
MITHPAYPVEPWVVRETHLDLEMLAQSESIFALSNGHVGLRGNLDEGEPRGIPGTYLTSFYELRPLPYAESAYGNPESSQSIVNVTNGKLIRLLVDDEPFDIRYGTLLSHERVLDLRAGTLRRVVDWVSPAAKRVRVSSTRLVSFSRRAIAMIEYEVEALDTDVRLVVQSELVANEEVPSPSRDPGRVPLIDPLEPLAQTTCESGVVLLHRTRRSGLVMAAAMTHVAEGAQGRPLPIQTSLTPNCARATVVGEIHRGERLRLVKYLGYGWSSMRSQQALRDQAVGAVIAARAAGPTRVLHEQRGYLDEFWDAADVEVQGDDEIQQAVRFGLFHVLQAGARTEGRGIGAKGLTGPGYDGHSFWDTEAFVLPVLTYTRPEAAAHALRWRHSTLDRARQRAATLGFRGAAFPWRTIRGEECSGYWPAGTAAVHVTADIALAFARYSAVTGDVQLELDAGVELLVEAARLWMSVGHHARDGAWHIAGVTGPDEYSALVDDNLYTNLAAARNLSLAADAAERHPDLARDHGVTAAEIAGWRAAAGSVHVPYDAELRVHQQHSGFTMLPEWRFDGSRDQYPLMLHAHYMNIYRKQVVKQADLELAMVLFGDRFSKEDKARNVDYYERRTVRDSSLSACIQAVICAEVGHLDLAHDHAYEAAMIDLRDLHNDSRDGLHIASLAGAWIALVLGFGGMRDGEGVLRFDPQLPPRLTRLRFNVLWRGSRLGVDVRRRRVTYALRAGQGGGGSITLRHGAEEIVLGVGEAVTRRIHPRRPLLPRPEQPPGREPAHRPVPGPQAARAGE